VEPRIRELVGELDRLVPVEGAAVIAYVDAFWQDFPPVARQKHYTAFLATPSGFGCFGVEFLKAALAPADSVFDGRHRLLG